MNNPSEAEPTTTYQAHPTRWRSVEPWWGCVLDAPDPRALGHYYANLLGWTIATEDDTWVTMGMPGGVSAYLAFQLSREYVPPVWPPADGKPQQMMHLDVEVRDLDAAVADAVGLGGTLAEFQPQDNVRVVLDPAGHPFCLYRDDDS